MPVENRGKLLGRTFNPLLASHDSNVQQRSPDGRAPKEACEEPGPRPPLHRGSKKSVVPARDESVPLVWEFPPEVASCAPVEAKISSWLF